MVFAAVPDKPRSADVKDQSPTMVTLTVQPPLDDGGMPVYGYRIEYEDTIQDFNLGTKSILLQVKKFFFTEIIQT